MDNSKMKKAYYRNILIISYVTALLAGYAFPIAGILSPQIANSLNINTANIVFIDGLFLVGLTIGSICSGKLLEIFDSVKSISIAALILLLVNLGFSLQESIILYVIFVSLNGFAMGYLIASVNYYLVSNFTAEGNQSDSKLNIMQFFVGIGCFVGAASVGPIVFHSSWRYVFGIAAILYLIIILLVLAISRKEFDTKVTKNKTINVDSSSNTQNKKFPSYVIMIAVALIAYVYTEYVISYWFSPYLQLDRRINIKHVSSILSIFWLTLAFGRMLIGKFILPKVSDFKLILCLAVLTMIGFIIFIFTNSLIMVYVSIIILGVGCSAIFPTLLAYGMKLSEGMSTYILSFLVMCGFFGGFLSLICSAVLGSYLPRIVPILTGPVWAFLIILFFVLAKKMKLEK